MRARTATGAILIVGRSEWVLRELFGHPALRHHLLLPCERAEQTFDWIDERPLDVVLMEPDIAFTVSLAIAREVSHVRPNIRMMALCWTASSQEMLEAIAARLFGCVTSPFVQAEIVDMLRAALNATDWPSEQNWFPVCHLGCAVGRMSAVGSRLLHVRSKAGVQHPIARSVHKA